MHAPTLAMMVLCLGNTAYADDDCVDTGRLGAMLGQIDQQCTRYSLTDDGRRVMIDLAAKAQPLGGEKCAEAGKIAMLQDLASPKLTKLAAKGDQAAFTAGLCDAIADYLKLIENGRPLFKRGR